VFKHMVYIKKIKAILTAFILQQKCFIAK